MLRVALVAAVASLFLAHPTTCLRFGDRRGPGAPSVVSIAEAAGPSRPWNAKHVRNARNAKNARYARSGADPDPNPVRNPNPNPKNPNAPVRVLHLTDLHGWVAGHSHLPGLDADYGDFVSLATHARETALSEGIDLFIMDTGDLIEGTGISDAVPGGYHGEYIMPMVARADYDAMTMGNHDLESAKSIDAIRREVVPAMKGGYLTSNTDVTATKEPLGGSYRVIEGAVSGRKVVVLGFIYNFMQAADVATVVEVEKALYEGFFAEAMAVEDVRMVFVLNHIAPQVDPGHLDLLKMIQSAIRRAKPDTPIVLLSGHSHVEDFKWYDDNSFTIESGKYFEEIGKVDFTLDASTGRLTNQSFSYEWVPTSRSNIHALAGVYPPHFVTPAGQEIKTQIALLTKELGLNEPQGCAPMTYDITAPLHFANSSYRLLIEEIAPKMLFDYSLPDIQFFIASTGFLRYNLYQGTVTRNDVWTMCGFNDSYAYFPQMPGSLLSEVITTLEGLSPSLHVKRPGCLAPEVRRGGTKQSDLMRRTTDPSLDVGADPPELPYFVYSYKKVEPTGTYDVVCNSYDAGTIQIAINQIYKNHGKNPDTAPTHQWYPNTISDTFMIRNYVRKYMTCDPSFPDHNPRLRLAKGDKVPVLY